MKKREGLGSFYQKGGPMGVEIAIMSNPGILAENNGAATYLTVNPACGLADWIIYGKAFVVRDDGQYPLSRGQVWGIQEMVHCAMDTYDMEPENILRGREALQQWATQYQTQSWTPSSGLGGVDIYGSKKLM